MLRSELLKYRELIEKGSASLPDDDAIEVVGLFPKWEVGTKYEVKSEGGVQIKPRIVYNDKLYRVEQTHTSQADWTPDITPALYSEVAAQGQGDTPDNPIPYNNNMELYKDKYYSQSGVVYICFRDTGIPVYNNLFDLVGLYVEIYG